MRARLRAALITSFVALAQLTASACAMTPERLPDLDRRFYYNLSTPEQQAEFLQLEESQRQMFLQNKGLWPRWTALSAEERKAVQTGEIKVGYREFAALMAWGPPADTREREAGVREVWFHTFIKCTSGPKIGKYVRNNLDCDGTADEIHLAVENDVITEIRYPD